MFEDFKDSIKAFFCKQIKYSMDLLRKKNDWETAYFWKTQINYYRRIKT